MVSSTIINICGLRITSLGNAVRYKSEDVVVECSTLVCLVIAGREAFIIYFIEAFQWGEKALYEQSISIDVE
ncbi:hypothetical protein TNCT_671261 [Trichonephila clavata]|uniref:Uncharacterized protein n=1 Tax=Trichonephila clavata TaxID=2740835 RepID=A0A8X6HM23_TRICU|nr:hypothetical protein TNCT_671261 [Trichonephila clavata]